MKKLTSFIPAALMFLILAVLFVFMCLPTGQISGVAEDGILDLRGSQTVGLLYSLRGDWQFAYGELLEPGEQPGRYGTIEVPSSWHTSGYPLNGAATYRLTVLTDYDGVFLLYVPDMPSAYAIWVNGEFIREAGTVSLEVSRVLYESALIPVKADNGEIEIVMQIGNQYSYHSGFVNPILLGEYETVMSWFVRTRTLYNIALGCILMMAFYHLALFIFRRREKVYLLFSVLCGLCFMRFFWDINGVNRFMQWIPMNEAGMPFVFLVFFLHCTAIIYFTLHVFGKSFGTVQKILAALYITFGSAYFMFIPKNNAFAMPIIMLIIYPLLIYAIIVAIRSPVLRKTPLAWLYLVALLLYLFAGTAGTWLMSGEWFMTGVFTNMFMLMSQSLVLSRRYTDAFKFVEETNQNLEQIVEDRTKSLQATNDAMKELIANISHDLKTPLSVLSVNLEKLGQMSENLDDIEYQRHVNIAYHKNLDMQRLLQNLFEASRIESGRGMYEPKWLSLNGLLADIQQKYGEYLEDKGIDLNISSGGDTEISIDPQKIWSVFDNIIYNAVRYIEGSGNITINCQLSTVNCQLSIADTGCGISPEHLPRIFERFYKGSSARGGTEGDSGLGLYIVKSIMEGLGGSVHAESAEGEGTTIHLCFISKTA